MSWRLEDEKFYPGQYYSPEYRIGKTISLMRWDFTDSYFSPSNHIAVKEAGAYKVEAQLIGSPKFMREDSIPHELWRGNTLEEGQKAFDFWVGCRK